MIQGRRVAIEVLQRNQIASCIVGPRLGTAAVGQRFGCQLVERIIAVVGGMDAGVRKRRQVGIVAEALEDRLAIPKIPLEYIEREAPLIVALTGRRIDAPNLANPRFPATNIGKVWERIERFFRDHEVATLVCSAACGADLLALASAGELGIRRRVVLPFASDRFRDTSVTDREGDWGSIYDRAIAEVKAAGELITLDLDTDNDQAYLCANLAILNESLLSAKASGDRAAAVLVWDGAHRGSGDITGSFGRKAGALGFELFEISTL